MLFCNRKDLPRGGNVRLDCVLLRLPIDEENTCHGWQFLPGLLFQSCGSAAVLLCSL